MATADYFILLLLAALLMVDVSKSASRMGLSALITDDRYNVSSMPIVQSLAIGRRRVAARAYHSATAHAKAFAAFRGTRAKYPTKRRSKKTSTTFAPS